ncbi:transcription initiation factor TFIID subunit 4 isoform X2 [Aethina tumida]|uniref:transcription initiation factor TFIID subunit 4 isoform X2 n=1 Tax=Aethina tumida TaxID=116153 RepID=UPI0021482C7C|nr:transcription initiation factor TFIID subunit 4 isoform X2 [Aethina tumida]
MASAKFLEEALSTDVDESAVNAIVGSLENQLVTSTPAASAHGTAGAVLSQNHVNSAIPNGGIVGPQQKHGTVANGDSITDPAKSVNSAMIVGGPALTTSFDARTASEPVKIVYTQGQASQVLPRVSIPNGTLGLQQTVLQSNAAGKQPTLVLKTSGAQAPSGIVTVPMNVTSTVPQANNQLTLQSFPGLQPGQQGALLLKTENGQYQLLRVGPPAAANLTNTSQPSGQPVTFRMQTVVTQPQISTATSPAQAGGTTTVTSAPQAGQTVQTPQKDNTKEKCRKFLANLLELSSREPKQVEKSVRTLIQELIDMRVEPEDFCDKLEKLLNASPQPCLIGFLKKSLPLLRHSLATQELTIEGIRPPPANVVFSIAGATPTVQTVVRPAMTTTAQSGQQQVTGAVQQQQVRIVGPATVVRPAGVASTAGAQVLQQRLVTPVRATAPGATRMVTAIRQPGNVIVSGSQPPALHPVYPNNQVRTVGPGGQIRQPITIRAGTPITAAKQPAVAQVKIAGGLKTTVPSAVNRLQTKEKEKKTFSSAYTGDDDINDVAAMGGVNLAEESQKILGSTEFVGTKIRSCKEEVLCSMGPLQQKIRLAMARHGLEDPGSEVAACISHAAQERIKNLIEKMAIITEHRLEIVKADQRYEITHDVKGQLKFLEDLDKAERKKHEELEREILLRAAKSRSKTEDPEQAKLKAKAKEMQRVEMEELRQREANATALQAIGPRKKPRLDGDTLSGSLQANVGGVNSGIRGQMPLRQRMKKVTLRDLQFLFESEKDLCKSKLLFKSYLK